MNGYIIRDGVPILDTSVPNVARIYDYLLGGKDHFAADREAAEELIRAVPDARDACWQNRGFLQRAVRFLVGEAGIRQFVDIGTGLPTQGNVHEIAHETDPAARVVYVDHDPMVVAHAKALLAFHEPAVAAIAGNLRHPEQILVHPDLKALISLDQPVAVLLVAVLHFLGGEDDPHKAVDALMSAVPSGSYLVISHITPDQVTEAARRHAQSVYADATARAYPRTRAQITRFFDGLEITEDGVVDVCDWGHDESRDSRTLLYSGVARKP
jgi:hypothetical protein